MDIWRKQPADIEPAPISAVDYLASAGGVTIASATAVVTDPPDNALTITTVTNSAGIVYVWLSGGTSGKDYHVTVTITTSGSPARTKEFDFKVKVREI